MVPALPSFVIPAQAGTQSALAGTRNCDWVPACAGMTRSGFNRAEGDAFQREGDIFRRAQSVTFGAKVTLSPRKVTLPAIKATKIAAFGANPVNLSTSILACP
jgi:hypothetical protein